MLYQHPLLSLAGLLFLLLVSLVALILTPTAIIRTALNDDLTKTKKALWILGELFICPLLFVYLIFVDKSRFLKFLSALVVVTFIICLIMPDTRKAIMAIAGSQTERASFQQQINGMQQSADLTSADFCASCMSSDPQQSKECLDHITLHLQLFAADIAAHRAYCSARPITPEIAKEQIAAWCKTVGPNYPFPEPRWKTMYAALAEKYPCPSVSTTPPP